MQMLNRNKTTSLKSEYRKTSLFRNNKDEVRYNVSLFIMAALCIFFILALIFYKNPVSISSPSFYPIINSRVSKVVVMIIAALCQSFATITFQSVTGNRVVTPSLLGFDAIYGLINTSVVFFMGVNALISFQGIGAFLFQTSIMTIICLLLYGSLLRGNKNDLNFVLLCGIIIGGGLRAISTFMRKMLSPAEYDILQSKLLGSVSNASLESLPIVIPIVLLVAFFLIYNSKKLDVLSLGEGIAINLGMDIKKNTFIFLTCTTLLMAVSASLTGSLTFLGFLVATLTYQYVKVYSHKNLFIYASLGATLIITSAYFIMNHIFHAGGSVMIIIEAIGGLTFVITLLRRGKN